MKNNQIGTKRTNERANEERREEKNTRIEISKNVKRKT